MAFNEMLTREGCQAELLNSIIRVGDEFAQEHVPVRIEAVDDNIPETRDIGLNGVSLEYTAVNMKPTW
jgi:hypothetical protein